MIVQLVLESVCPETVVLVEMAAISHKKLVSIIVGCPTKDFCEFALTELHTPV
jgi:hypothetical protein